MAQSIEEKVVFGVAPAGTGDGVQMVLFGIPAAAWENLKNGKCSTFDLTKLGIPVKVALYGAANHAAAMELIEGYMSKEGVPYINALREDFAIKSGAPDDSMSSMSVPTLPADGWSDDAEDWT